MATPRPDASFIPIEDLSSEAEHSSLLSASTGSWDRWVVSVLPAATQQWSYSSRSCKTTSSTLAAEPAKTSYGWRSSPGLNGPTTIAVADSVLAQG